jgi:hypothetical protein
MLVPKESIIDLGSHVGDSVRQSDRWQYCWDTEENKHVYLHLNCDVVAENGYCIACGSADPLQRLSDRNKVSK